ncbi:MAG: helix-turn-helix domain-containing protein, partial [Cellulosilyticaceae bacterium]
MNIGKNIKKLREGKQITQEQLGKLLNVSHQAVSKWENGVALPDISLLPEMGRVLGALVDDLLKDEIDPYESYAERLATIYAESRTQENFLRAEEEYRKIIESGQYTSKQLSMYGGLYHDYMHDCRRKTFEIYDKVIEMEKDNKGEFYYDMLRERVSLQAQLGQYNQAIEACKKVLEEEPESAESHNLMLSAYRFCDQYEEGLEFGENAMKRFPNHPLIVYGVAECYAHFERYDEAFKYW